MFHEKLPSQANFATTEAGYMLQHKVSTCSCIFQTGTGLKVMLCGSEFQNLTAECLYKMSLDLVSVFTEIQRQGDR